jgi:hypothetical protein
MMTMQKLLLRHNYLQINDIVVPTFIFKVTVFRRRNW